MKVIMTINSLDGGGSERVMSDLANYFDKKGWEVVIVTFSNSKVQDHYKLNDNILRKNIDIKSSGNFFSKMVRNVRQIFYLRIFILKLKPDTVLSFLTTRNVISILSTLFTNTRTVVSERTNPKIFTGTPLVWRLGRFLFYRYADLVIVQTKEVESFISKHTNAKTLVLPNPLRQLAEQSYKRENIITSIGRIDEYKNQKILIKAFIKIHNNYPHWKLVIIGKGTGLGEIKRMVIDNNMLEHIQILGWVDNIEEWYSKSGIIFQPSLVEGTSNVVLEAMAMGAPIVAHYGCSNHLIKDNFNGRLVNMNDCKIILSILSELIEDKEQRLRIGNNARSVKYKYSHKKIMPLWEEALTNL